MSIDVGNVRAPHSIGAIGIKLFIQNVVKLFAEIGVNRSSNPRLDPLSPDAQLTHIKADGAFSKLKSFFPKDLGDLGSPIILMRKIVDVQDSFFDPLPSQFSFRGFMLKKGLIAGTGNAEVSQHSGEGDPAFRSFGGLHHSSDFDVNSSS